MSGGTAEEQRLRLEVKRLLQDMELLRLQQASLLETNARVAMDNQRLRNELGHKRHDPR